MAPATRALFRGDLRADGRMLAHMLQFLVYALARPESLALGLRELGDRHAKFGVVAAHYPILRTALLETAEDILGERHTPEVGSAWAATVDTIIDGMLGRTRPAPCS